MSSRWSGTASLYWSTTEVHPEAVLCWKGVSSGFMGLNTKSVSAPSLVFRLHVAYTHQNSFTLTRAHFYLQVSLHLCFSHPQSALRKAWGMHSLSVFSIPKRWPADIQENWGIPAEQVFDKDSVWVKVRFCLPRHEFSMVTASPPPHHPGSPFSCLLCPPCILPSHPGLFSAQ